MYGKEMTPWESREYERFLNLLEYKSTVKAERDVLRTNDCVSLSAKVRDRLQQEIDDAYDDLLFTIQNEIDDVCEELWGGNFDNA